VTNQKQFSEYFQRELSYLRNSGARFATQFPKIARRLDLSGVESSDPHVERLLQSFAFLTARLQRDVEDEFPRIANAILETLYPQFIAPLPSYAITKFEIDETVGKLTQRYHLPKGTPLFTHAVDDEICYFQSGFNLDLYPLELQKVEIVSARGLDDIPHYQWETSRVLKIKLHSLAGALGIMDLQSLQFHIFGDPVIQNSIYEALFVHDAEIGVVYGNEESPEYIDAPRKNRIRAMGLSEDEFLLPYPSHGHPGYHLLQEYFAYPQKFMFFDILELQNNSASQEMTLYISLADHLSLPTKDIDVQNFQLGCVPIVNLFQKISEPIRFDHKTVEYRLIPDSRRELTTEIQSIKSVTGSVTGQNKTIPYAPYFSFNHHHVLHGQQQFWVARRVFSDRPGYGGSDIYLSFVDYEFNPKEPADQTISAEILCTNRGLANQIPVRGALNCETAYPGCKIYCLDRPTRQLYPNRETSSLWRLVSQLSIGHLGLTSDEQLTTLKELVRLFGDFGDGRDIPEIDVIADLKTSKVVRRIGYEAWRGFVQGTKIDITFEDTSHQDVSAFLFATVMNQIFPSFAAINSFTELEISHNNRKGVWKQWPSRVGSRGLL
jgi:type VI secretion system protein ImpG